MASSSEQTQTSLGTPYPFGPPCGPTFEKIETRLHDWKKQYPDIFNLNIVGQSVQGRSIYATRLTDPRTSDNEKEHTLLTALHAGQERGGGTGVLYIMQWLLSGDPLAKEILRKQIIAAMPIVNPDHYINWAVINGLGNMLQEDPYTAWNVDGPLHPDRCPEAVSVQKVMDEFQADVHSDIHGNSMPYPDVYAIEESGSAYSNPSLRAYHSEISQLMNEAALAEGYPSDFLESDAERIFGGGELDIIPEKLWSGFRDARKDGNSNTNRTGVQRVYAALYGYNRYHTMTLANESAWEHSAFVRHRRLLEVGNQIWPGEYYPGYPVRVLMKNGLHMITAYGQTAAERRRSRIELWNKQRQFFHGYNNPSAAGRLIYVCATSLEARVKWLSDLTLNGFVTKMKEHPHMHAARIREVVQGFPEGPGQWGKTSGLAMTGGTATDISVIEHGISIRLRIPYSKARGFDLWMNGERVAESERDGFTYWVARGFSHFQINIPPEKSRIQDLFVITCQWDPGEARTVGLDW